MTVLALKLWSCNRSSTARRSRSRSGPDTSPAASRWSPAPRIFASISGELSTAETYCQKARTYLKLFNQTYRAVRPMGDWFQTLVFRSVGEDEAREVGEKVRDWLLTREIITGDPSPEPVPGKIGHRPGPSALSACDRGSWAPFFDLTTNGVEIQIGRRLFCEMNGAEFFALCELCGHRFELMEYEPALDAFAAFGDGAEGRFGCPACGHEAGLVDWQTDGIAGGFLGVTFWNWWPLTPAFRAQMSQLAASEILLIESKL